MFNSQRAPYASYFSEKEYYIIEAIHNNDKGKLRDMMDEGWDINSSGKFGMTYLLYAIWSHNYKMTEFLLENGADPNLVSNFWETTPDDVKPRLPLEISCYDDYKIKFMKLLIRYGADVNDDRAPLPIFSAALNDDRKKIEYLLEHGADINKFDKGMETVITNQATAYQWDMVLWLWDKGADPMKTGKNGFNVAVWVQNAIDKGGNMDKIKARLESIGVKFPYRPVQQEEQDSVKVNCEEN